MGKQAGEGHHGRGDQGGGADALPESRAGEPAGVTPAQAVINHSAELGHCTPIRVKRFKVAKTIRRAVDRDYIDRFVAEASADLGAMMLFMNQSGCRIGPATALTWAMWTSPGARSRCRRTRTATHVFDLSPEVTLMLGLLPKDRRKVFGYASRHAVYNGTKGACARAGIHYLGTRQARIWHGPRHACRISCRAPSLVSRPLKKDFWHVPSQY